jgi:hypothetical protein
MKSVGFVGEAVKRNESGVSGDLYATGFFVSVPLAVRGHYLYFVTARHVAKDLADRDIHSSVNKHGGGTSEVLAIEPAMWYLHPYDPNCDLAVARMAVISEADSLAVPAEEMLTPESIEEFGIGIGDEVFAIGLFTPIDNATRNIPILRHQSPRSFG